MTVCDTYLSVQRGVKCSTTKGKFKDLGGISGVAATSVAFLGVWGKDSKVVK